MKPMRPEETLKKSSQQISPMKNPCPRLSTPSDVLDCNSETACIQATSFVKFVKCSKSK